MKCQTASSVRNNGNSYPSATARATFLENKIEYKCEGSAPTGIQFDSFWYYYRGSFSITTTIGTKAPLLMDMSRYSALYVINSKGLQGVFRVGSTNNGTTNLNTATILTKGTINTDNGLTVNLENGSYPYLVLGNTYTSPAPDSDRYGNAPPAGYSANYSSDITEIYLA